MVPALYFSRLNLKVPPTNKYYIEIEIYGLINMFAGREETSIENI